MLCQPIIFSFIYLNQFVFLTISSFKLGYSSVNHSKIFIISSRFFQLIVFIKAHKNNVFSFFLVTIIVS